jgi:hypothetical protein
MLMFNPNGTGTGTPEHQHPHGHHSNAMRPPGMAILTPQVNRIHAHDDEADTTRTVLFPHPLRTVSESPQQLEVTTHLHLSQSASESVEEQENDNDNDNDDDAAYLPDDFEQQAPVQINTYTGEQVLKLVEEAETSIREHLEDQHQHALEEFQEEAEKALAEHGSQWKKDADAEYQRMDTLLKEEKSKTQQKHRDLLLHTTEMSELQEQLQHQAKEKEESLANLEAKRNQSDQAKELYQTQLNQEIQAQQEQLATLRKENNVDELKSRHVQELQAIQDGKDEADQRVGLLEQHSQALEEELLVLNQQTGNDQANAEEVERYQEELRHLQASKDEADQEVLALQDQVNDLRQQVNSSNMEELIVMKSEKAAAERQISDLQEQLDSRMGGHKNAQAQLRDAHSEIATLKQQLKDNNSAPSKFDDQLNISAISEVSQREELFAANAEVETLRVLRAEEEKERHEQLAALMAERDDLQSTL